MRLLTKDDYVLSLSLSLARARAYTSTFARRESLSTLHDAVVNVFSLLCARARAALLFFSCLCRFLPASFVQERKRAVQGMDKLLTPSMHLCVCARVCSSFWRRRTFRFLHIINFPFLQFSRFVTDK